VQFFLDVVQGGSYRFYVNVEAISASTPPPRPSAMTPVTGGVLSVERVSGARPSSNTLSPTRKAVVAKSRTSVAPGTRPITTRGVVATTPTATAPARKR
jgi:hypothetical protein